MSNAPEPLMSALQLESSRVASRIAQPGVDFKLSDHQWQHRLVLIFAPTERSPAYQQQKQLWQTHQAGMQERDLKLVEIFAAGDSRVDGHPMTVTSAEQLRKQFGIGSDTFAVLLIGKDGTEKQRETMPVAPDVLFRTIDAMPMRQQEQRQQKQRNRR